MTLVVFVILCKICRGFILPSVAASASLDWKRPASRVIRPPYAVYFQGGLTWYHAKLGILMSLQKLVEQGLVAL